MKMKGEQEWKQGHAWEKWSNGALGGAFEVWAKKGEDQEKLTIRSGQVSQSKKGEDFTLIKLECIKIL
jgi:hypothetical protein